MFDAGRAAPIVGRLAIAVLAVVGLFATQQAVLPAHTDHVLWIAMVAAVLVTSALAGLLPSVVAAFLAAVLIDLWLFEPAGTGILTSGHDAIALLLFLVVAVFGASAATRPMRTAARGGPTTEAAAPLASLDGGELIEPLTDRELEVLVLLSRGLSNGEIARDLVVSPNTVKTHLEHLYGKLGVPSRGRAVAEARSRGLLPSGEEQITSSGDESRPSGGRHRPIVAVRSTEGQTDWKH